MLYSTVLPAQFEFHISKEARDTYQFDDQIFSMNGNVIFANFFAAREFAQKINAKRNLIEFPETAIRASDINAMGLIDEILHALFLHYRTDINPGVVQNAVEYLQATIGTEQIDHIISRFVELFPPVPVYNGDITVQEYLSGKTEDYSNRLATFEEIVMLWLANNNPAFNPFEELFDDQLLINDTNYDQIFSHLYEFFEDQPKLENLNFLDALQEPVRKSPNSLAAQLEFLLRKWQVVIGSKFLLRVLGSLDFIKEESKVVIGTGGGGPDAAVYEFDLAALEPEMFSPDMDWMPSLVLLAKNSYVWLDQLSKKYQQDIRRLDQIPDIELDSLRSMGFGGLWLIGLWERSPASQRIKQLCGNPEAVASAYSLYDYVVAQDLGGEDAYENLRQRAWRRGIRLAADMVPNHVGIYSKWVIEHPDWFISLNYSPYPTYTFNGPDLSDDQRVGIFVEDHYYSRSDAAVVFKRVDRWTGDERYIYHGNDGTSMPWNDTAQLNYLNPEVREAVIQTILHVAKKFRVIRFDAAMTLAKKHYQRLWFPEPGSGGDIPTRAEHGLTKSQFDAAMPEEFWREVVDRVAAEVPDTLLLAEAFWLMEGYFVRTLGMHRVYNSAFMNMLRDEKNAEYRLVIKNTLEFDPEILKRYVNFMNNPDERTAVEQFGKGDKYFGVAVMMSTMPGLPMFGHGQIEGYTEKYGMEYRKAYWDEQPDSYLVDRHRREISPLLHKRYMYAGVEHFLLYDFFTEDGNVDEDVFAYSNQVGVESSIVLIHNRFKETKGWIKTSAAFAVKTGDGDEKSLVQLSVLQGLGINPEPAKYIIFKDQRTDLEYIRNSQELADKGLYFELNAYDYHIFTEFREVYDNEWQHYRQLTAALGVTGVVSIDEALRELFLQSILNPFRELINPGQLDWLIQSTTIDKGADLGSKQLTDIFNEVEAKVVSLYTAISEYTTGVGDITKVSEEIVKELKATFIEFDKKFDVSKSGKNAAKYLQEGLRVEGYATREILLTWDFVHRLAEVMPANLPISEEGLVQQTSDWLDEWLLKKVIRQCYRDMGYDDQQIWKSVSLLSLLVKYQNWYKKLSKKLYQPQQFFEQLLSDEETNRFLGVNRYQNILWFNKEAMDMLLWGMYAIAGIQIMANSAEDVSDSKTLTKVYRIIKKYQKIIDASEYQVNNLLGKVEN